MLALVNYVDNFFTIAGKAWKHWRSLL